MSKIPPAHIWFLPDPLIMPRFKSAEEMGQVVPPKEMVAETEVVHA